MKRNLGAALVAVVGLCAYAAPAAAQEDPYAQARTLFERGMVDLKAGISWQQAQEADPAVRARNLEQASKRFQTACPALRESFRLDQRAEVLFNVAKCEDLAGRITTAAAVYDDYLALFHRLSVNEQDEAEKKREREAVSRREALDRIMPRVIFQLPDALPPGLRVTRRLDSAGASNVPIEVAVGVPLPIDPGKHFVATEAPDRARWETTFTVEPIKDPRAANQPKVIMLQVAPPDPIKATRFSRPIEPVPNVLPPLDPGISAHRVSAYVTGGIGIVGVLTGVVTGAITWGQKGVISANCQAADTDKQICNKVGQSAADTAKTLGLVSTAAFIVGGVCLVTGIVLYVTEPAPAKLGAVPSRFSLGLNAGPKGPAAVTTWTW